jgi:hypothetical protein
MDKETELFYNKHKDIKHKLPLKPDDLNEKDGVVMGKWYLQQMLDNDIGYIELDLATVNPPKYEDIGLHFKGRLETDSVIAKAKPLQLGKGLSGVTMFMGKWLNAGIEIPVTADWWHNCSAVEKLRKVNYWKLDPQGYIPPHNWNTEPTSDTIESMDLMSYPWMYMVSLIEPGADCHTVVEDCGMIPIQMGKVYLLNPKKKLQIVNTGSTPSVRMFATVEVGNEFLRFCDLMARSYFRYKFLMEHNEN